MALVITTAKHHFREIEKGNVNFTMDISSDFYKVNYRVI